MIVCYTLYVFVYVCIKKECYSGHSKTDEIYPHANAGRATL